MQTSIPSKEVTTRQPQLVSFSFYTDEQIRKLSVKKITSPITYGNLKDVVPGGLYDPAMGPIDTLDRCGTCHLTHAQCPGHFGHIELPLPVYNPLTFRTLYRLMRTVCLHCFKFKMARHEVARYQEKMELLLQGKVAEATAVRLEAKAMESVLDELGVLKGKSCAIDDASPAVGKGSHDTCITSVALASLQETEAAFFRRFTSVRCPNCKAMNPNIVKQGFTKIFKVFKSKKTIRTNLERGIVIQSVLDAGLQPKDMELEMAAKLQAASEKRKRSKDGATAGGAATEDDDDDDDDDALDDLEEEEEDDYKEDDKDFKDDKDVKDMDVDVKVKEKGENGVEVTAVKVAAQPMASTDSDLRPMYMAPLEVEEIMKRLWHNEHSLLQYIFPDELGAGPTTKGQPQLPKPNAYKMFFLRTIAVTPNKFRPPMMRGDDKYEHDQNVSLAAVLNAVLDLQNISPELLKQGGPAGELQLNYYTQAWLRLQTGVCTLMDSTTIQNPTSVGIRQHLEKKEGLFRKNMMGKRVNFAARSVISPDPYIATGEIGVPPYFAKRLSYPERVTVWNVELLRQLVINGADTYPGAVAVEDEHGVLKQLKPLSRQSREAIAKQLLSGSSRGRGSKPGKHITGVAHGSKIVYRHLRDGDIMLTNRQPTLHKPGLMAHRARVLKGERTIRMHYANCATFNADFDGDELNLHFPQDHLARAEGYHIVHSDEQYIVPTDGKPIRGLIQDHIIAGALLMKRDSFFTRAEYMQMVYVACSSSKPAAAALDRNIELELPTILKPRVLWSGKQVLSTLLRHFTRGLIPITHTAEGKIPRDYWGKNSEEGELNIWKGYVVSGVMDKSQYGKYGLVHAMQELYGNKAAGAIISAFSRLFTFFHQWHGFTCGIDDVLLVEAAEQRRKALLQTAEQRALKASADFVGVQLDPVGGDPTEFAEEEMVVRDKLSERYRANKDAGIGHDMKASGAMAPLASEVVKTCLPSGQVKPFPDNCMALMTVSGAKGSLVNFSQISCLLGQQELEGRRVPRMASGKTLPCFQPYDPGARAGGFIGDRFLSGLRPQEYYFHCMAGREGLVDTTVKTSRSGYLQRCVIKNLESLCVHYDYTVRDSCDGSIVQFMYGEDGIDVMNTSYLQRYSFLAKNAARFAQKVGLNTALAALTLGEAKESEKQVAKHNKRRQMLLSKAHKKAKYSKQLDDMMPVTAVHPLSTLGCVSERFEDELAAYMRANPDGLLKTTQEEEDGANPKAGEKARSKKKKTQIEGAGHKNKDAVDPEDFLHLMQLKYMQSLAAPGEAVGVIAGQSVGEPSTQMTLNTFHMAGRGEANVTLGIPRLREILMSASSNIKTPVMTLPLRAGLPVSDGHVLAGRLRRLRLAECLSGITVDEKPVAASAPGKYERVYHILLQFFPPAKYPPEMDLHWDDVVECFKDRFIHRLKTAIKKELKSKDKTQIDKVELSALRSSEDGPMAAHSVSEGGEEDEVGGSNKQKKKSEKDDAYEDDEDDEDMVEGKLRFRGEKAVGTNPEDDDEEDDNGTTPAAGPGGGDDEDEDEDGDGDVVLDALATTGRVAVGRGSKAATPSKKKRGKSDLSGEFLSTADATAFTCSVTIRLPLTAPKLLMLDIVEQVAASTMLRWTPNIEKCYVLGGERGGIVGVQTDGINFEGAWMNSDLADVNRITTNHIRAMLDTYGVEAARATIMHEVQSVFKAYGIGVDPRHLSLIADFMTHEGGYRGCNRAGIESNTSPILKMSFETATKFLMDATLKGAVDDLKSPASQICIGKVVELGTGMVDLVQQI